MDPLEFAGINDALAYVLRKISAEGISVSPREIHTKELLGVSFIIKDPRRRRITLRQRKWNYALAIGELAWHLSASRDLSFISYYQPKWERFSVNGKQILGSCYGYRIFDKGASGESQWESLISCLTEDPSSRRGVISIADKLSIEDINSPDIPCISSIQFFIRDGKLNCITYMRSNDAIWGMCYDVFFVTFLQELLATVLGLKLGFYQHFCGSLHYYDRHKEMVASILRRPGAHNPSYGEQMAKLTHPHHLKQFLRQEEYIRLHGEANLQELSLMPTYWKEMLEPLMSLAAKRHKK